MINNLNLIKQDYHINTANHSSVVPPRFYKNITAKLDSGASNHYFREQDCNALSQTQQTSSEQEQQRHTDNKHCVSDQ